MARTSGVTRAASTVRSRAAVLPFPIEMKFRHVVRGGGQDVTFDLDVRAGDASDLDIVSPFLPEYSYHEEALLTPATNGLRGIRVSTERPLFVFSRGDEVLLSVQVDLSAAKPRVMGAEALNVRVR